MWSSPYPVSIFRSSSDFFVLSMFNVLAASRRRRPLSGNYVTEAEILFSLADVFNNLCFALFSVLWPKGPKDISYRIFYPVYILYRSKNLSVFYRRIFFQFAFPENRPRQRRGLLVGGGVGGRGGSTPLGPPHSPARRVSNNRRGSGDRERRKQIASTRWWRQLIRKRQRHLSDAK